MIRINVTTPRVRNAMSEEDRTALHAFHDEPVDGYLSLYRPTEHGVFVGRLSIPGREEIRTSSITLAGLLEALIREVNAL
jgi:hypothetical protein